MEWQSFDKQHSGKTRLILFVGVAVVVHVVAVVGAVGFTTRTADSDTAPLSGVERRDLEELAHRSTLRVSAIGCEGDVSGSGFVVDGVVVTSRHLVHGAVSVQVGGSGGTDATADARELPVRATSRAFDLATVGSGQQGGLEIADSDAEAGSPVILAGWVDGDVRVLDAVVGLHTEGGAYGVDGQVMLLEPSTTYGFSGGPVLDRKGHVVGVLKGVDLVTGLTVAVPVSQLRSWLQMDAHVAENISCINQEYSR